MVKRKKQARKQGFQCRAGVVTCQFTILFFSPPHLWRNSRRQFTTLLFRTEKLPLEKQGFALMLVHNFIFIPQPSAFIYNSRLMSRRPSWFLDSSLRPPA